MVQMDRRHLLQWWWQWQAPDRRRKVGVSGGKTVASWAGGGPNCVVKESAGCAFGCVFGLCGYREGRAERLRVRGGAMVVSVVRFVVERVLGA